MPTPFSPSDPGRYQWIMDHRKLIFWICLAGTLITGYLQVAQNKQLKNEAAPEGIMSLETYFSFTSDTSIVAAWQQVK
ncbi:MAG TPA: hypothetical protein VK645_18705, partial [Chitinophagaceae bacterium]|nr:hypothetical protein [Chitinophagaceae bacterium]